MNLCCATFSNMALSISKTQRIETQGRDPLHRRGWSILTNTVQASFKSTGSPPPPCWLTLRPGGWWHYVRAKRWTPTTLHGVTSQKIVIFNVKPVNTTTRTFQASQWRQEGTFTRKFHNDVSFSDNGDKTRVNRWLTDTKQGTINYRVYAIQRTHMPCLLYAMQSAKHRKNA